MLNMTGPITILTHDYSTSVLNKIDHKIYGKSRKNVIGNNVFLGWGCTVLAGTIIENNVIIGARDVISGKVEKNISRETFENNVSVYKSYEDSIRLLQQKI